MMIGLIRHLIGGLILLCAISAQAHASIGNLPAASNPEKRCFANVRTPAKYETRRQKIEIRASYDVKRYLPASVEHKRLRIETKEASLAYATRAPVYETVFEQVLVAPERVIKVKHPAKYLTWTEKIEISPAMQVWKRCGTRFGPRKARSAVNTTEGKIVSGNAVMCRRAIPAKERSVHHTKLVKDAWTEQKTIPAQYKTVARQVLKHRAEAMRLISSPEYTPVSVAREIAPARYEMETIPALFSEETKEVLVGGNQLIRAEVLCDAQVSRAHVAKMQSALVERGYKIRVDGIYGPETQGAMEQFQADQALSKGYMTMETVQALGVDHIPCSDPSCRTDRVLTTVKATQLALSEAGFFTRADGLHGPQTQASLEAFQRRYGLKVGILSAESMKALNIGSRI